MGFLETVLAGLVVAAVTGAVGWMAGRQSKENEYKQKHAAAIKTFAGELRKLISSANPSAGDVIITARSIVSVRNSLKATLTTLASALNSNIDLLQEVVGVDNRPVPDSGAVRERLAILQKSWPAKEAEIEVSIRKMLAEMGIVER
jgi:hypothetical protein